MIGVFSFAFEVGLLLISPVYRTYKEMKRVEEEPKDDDDGSYDGDDDDDDDGNNNKDSGVTDKTALDKVGGEDGVATEGAGVAAERASVTAEGAGVAAEADGVDTEGVGVPVEESGVPAEATNVAVEEADVPAKEGGILAEKSDEFAKNDSVAIEEFADVPADINDDDDGVITRVPAAGEIEHWPVDVELTTSERVSLVNVENDKVDEDGDVAEDAEKKEEPVVVVVPNERRSLFMHWVVYGTFRAFELVARPLVPSFDVLKIILIFWLCLNGSDSVYEKVVMPVLDEYGPIIDYLVDCRENDLALNLN
jgi:hypothetical protein